MTGSISDPTFAAECKLERINFKRTEDRPIYRRLTHIPTGIVIDGEANEVAASLVKRLQAKLDERH